MSPRVSPRVGGGLVEGSLGAGGGLPDITGIDLGRTSPGRGTSSGNWGRVGGLSGSLPPAYDGGGHHLAKLEGDPWALHPTGPNAALTAKSSPAATAVACQPLAVPAAWVVHTDPATGKRFWHNQDTGESRWEEEEH